MKIGFDLSQYSRASAGGGWYAFALLDAIAKLAPGVQFLGYRHFCQWINDPSLLASLPLRSNVSDPLAGASLESATQIWQHSLTERKTPGEPDLVHSTSFQAPRLCRQKLVVTIYDLSFWAVPEYTTDRIRLDCQNGVLDAIENANGLIFISEHAREEFGRFLPRFRRKRDLQTIVIPLASRWPKAEHSSEGEHWLFVGSIEPRKNLETLLFAYEKYAVGHAAPKPLLLAGGVGWKNAPIRARVAELEGSGRVRLLGYVPEEKLREYYRRAVALLYPSWYEGFGLPIVEAMSQGCPVVCSRSSSLPEVGGDAVLYVDPGDPAGMTEAMHLLEADSTTRQQQVMRGLARSELFSWDRSARQTMEFYERVLALP